MTIILITCTVVGVITTKSVHGKAIGNLNIPSVLDLDYRVKTTN